MGKVFFLWEKNSCRNEVLNVNISPDRWDTCILITKVVYKLLNRQIGLSYGIYDFFDTNNLVGCKNATMALS